jgi:Ca-activated chloride channel family protein
VTVERPLLLWLAPLIALAVTLLAGWARQRRIRAAAAWQASLGAQAAAHGRWSVPLLGLATLLAAIALAGPRWGLASRSAESRALNVAFVMDISRSMLAADADPDRLTRTVRVARRLVQDLSGDRLALIAFAQRAYLLSPLTLDQSALAVQLDALDPTVASEGGSSIGTALSLARQVLLAASEGGDRVVVLFTDGEAFDGEAAVTSAAEALAGERIALVTVPVGGVAGIRIPDGEGGWHRDGLGNEVVTARRDDILQALTRAGEGVLIDPEAPDPAGDVRRVLDRLDRRTVRDQMAADLVPRAWLFALGALALLGLQTLTRRTAALAALALACGIVPATAQRPTTGWRFLDRGDTARALEAFRRDVERSGGDTAWYNAGTAALAGRDFAGAIGALERATLGLDPALRRDALYNLGTAQLALARTDTARRDSLLGSAERALRQALQLDPRDAAAKHNYELARRLMRPPPPPQGGGSSGEPPPSASQQPPPRGEDGMSEAEAEQVLNAMERTERETRQQLARRQRRNTVAQGPDW